MASIRVRYPSGVSTLQIPLGDDSFTVQDLQQQIYKASGILPSRQILKSGYPPKDLTIVPELPLSSLGLKSGEQILISENAQLKPSQLVPLTTSSPMTTAARQASSTSSKTSTSPEHVETDGGFLVHRVVPDDNSCLFSSVSLVFEQDMNKAPQMRKIVADGIQSDPEKFSEAILGMPPQKYVTAILKPTTWGGAIELGILATHYKTEIASIDVETGRVDHFTPNEEPTENRCLLIYSGIHYDAATLSPMLDAPSEWHQTLFPVGAIDDSDPIILAGKQLATQLRAKKAFTNTATFDLKCEQCGQGLKGEKGARAHAEATGHVRFGEY